MRSPLEQFEIIDWIKIRGGWVDLSITNSTIGILIGIIIIYMMSKKIEGGLIIGKEYENIIEMKKEFVEGIIEEQIGEKGREYRGMIMTIFGFILINNMIGMIPYSFTPTSHLAVTLYMSFSIFFGVTILGFMIHGIRYLKILLPEGVSVGLIPLIVVIETISYCMRAVSLGVRLAANMLAGHALLHIISGFTWNFMTSSNIIIKVLGIIPLIVLIALTGLELIIAFLQAYVFTVLTSSYINDAINMH